MKGHRANLANIVISDRVVLQSCALADPEFERENGIGNFLDHTRPVSVVANAMKINAHRFADVCLKDVAQLTIHRLRKNLLHATRLANLLFAHCSPLFPLRSSLFAFALNVGR
jgi:hypothetical protein